MSVTETKRCTKCSVVKPLEEFHRDKGTKDGRVSGCKPCALARVSVWSKANPDKRRAWREANVERVREQSKEYRTTHPEPAWLHRYRRRVRKYGFTPVVEHFTKADVIARWGATCWHCPDGEFEELDHFPVSVIDGGEHTLENVRPSCKRSNIQGIRGARIRRGLLAEQEQIEATNLALLKELRSLATA